MRAACTNVGDRQATSASAETQPNSSNVRDPIAAKRVVRKADGSTTKYDLRLKWCEVLPRSTRFPTQKN